MELPQRPHSNIICGSTDCGKTRFILDLLETHYRGTFEYIIILCPSIRHNKTYLERRWIWIHPNVIVKEKCEKLHDCLRDLYDIFQGKPTLYIIDDMASSAVLTKKKDMLSTLAVSGRMAQQNVWILTQAYTSVLRDFRLQTKWVALFHCKDRDSFDKCLRENDVVPAQDKAAVRAGLASTPYSKLLMKTDPPAEYMIA